MGFYSIFLILCITTMLFGIKAQAIDNFFMGLGDLPGGELSSSASAVSADGSVVVGSSSSKNGNEAFRWSKKYGIEGLGDLPGGEFRSAATSVSADGSVVVGSASSKNGIQAFRWTKATGLEGLGDLPGGKYKSVAYHVSAD